MMWVGSIGHAWPTAALDVPAHCCQAVAALQHSTPLLQTGQCQIRAIPGVEGFREPTIHAWTRTPPSTTLTSHTHTHRSASVPVRRRRPSTRPRL
jgi:hypothetical protein